MLITLVFPIADLRFFTEGWLGRLNRPDWRNPDIEQDFVRSFGPICERMLGGGNDYLSEGYFCRADRAINSLVRITRPRSDWRVGLVRHFSRLYCNGSVLTKWEIGTVLARRADRTREPRTVCDLGRALLEHQTSLVRRKETNVRPLLELGQSFATFYQICSTRTSYPLDLEDQPDQRLVRACSPLLVTHLNNREPFELPPDSNRLRLGRNAKHDLFHSRIKVHGRSVRLWTIAGQRAYHQDPTRLLRMYLIRLYTEHQVLRTILRNLENPHIHNADERARDRMQTYLNDATRRINRMARKSSRIVGHEMGTLAREAEDTIRPGDIAMLEQSIDALYLDRGISYKAKQYLQRDATVFVTVQQGGILDMTQETHNKNFNYGQQGAVQQAGARANQTVGSIQTSGNPENLSSAVAALKDLVEQMQSKIPAEQATDAKKAIAHLDAELSTEGATPDKGIVLSALEKIGSAAEKAEQYAEPVGKIIKLIRKFVGF